ncbi:MAG TPA: SpoIID/LytB domain-containing protein [Pyrinomonadaceae bacterium]|nr:SpoIID/LytB domain-containing protein [Pyrinomonadaceae bacterium]
MFVLFAWALPGGLNEQKKTAAAALGEAAADEALRRAAESALGRRAGVILVLDAQTGRLRAAVGGRLAFAEATPPGSAVKPFTALAALAEGALTEETRHSCRGRYEREGFRATCAHPRYRTRFDPRAALANSCNDFFGRAAEATPAEAFARTLEQFGFGAATGGGGDSETAGALPREGLRAAEMLGESERLRVTPAQLVTAYAALFNGGRLLVPARHGPEDFAPQERARLRVDEAHRALLLEGMRGAVSYGTASRAGLSTLPVRVFGKTGTSTPPEGFRPQGWFVGLATDTSAAEAPPESVRVAVLVYLRRGHGADAAVLARPVFAAYARTLAHDKETAAALGDDPRDGDGDDAGVDESSGADSLGEAGGASVRVRLAREDSTLTLALEDYVFGVLAAEGSVENEPEALKALAVVARTYALRNLRRHGREPFDLCDTTHCQRYAPVRDEGARPEFYELLRRAVRETAGEVLRDRAGRAAEVYFSASCGGSTADVRTLWGAREAPPQLRGVADASCASDAHAWTDAVSAEDLLRALRADRRSDVGAHLDSVRVARRDAGGRAELVELAGERRRVLRGWDFKIIVGRTLGWGVLKSSRFEVARSGRRFVFRGRGFGHGLGLCQAGAHRLAARGAGYKQILGHYLPGAGLRVADCGLRNDGNCADAQPRPALRPAGMKSDERAGVGGEEYAALRPRFTRASFSTGNDEARTPFHSAIRSPQSAIRASAILSSEHFRLSYPAGVARREAESVLRALEAAHADLSRRLERASLGRAAPDAVEVFAHATTGDFVGATGQPAWAAAATSGRRVELQPLGTLRRRGVLAAVLRHELAHVACEMIGRGRAPRWLVEGLAAHFAGEGASLARAADGGQLPLEELDRRLARPASAAEMRALYAAAYREVAAIIRREGESGAWRRVAAGRAV